MPDNTNVNANSAVVVVGRTAPVPPGQQKAEKSIPVVIASDQTTIPVAEQNKVQSEVALSLLGIPRSEVALGIFADVNTYDVNPTEWAATPEQYGTLANSGTYTGIGQTMGHGLTHVPEESGALLEAPADKSSVLTSKRFFRYQPGRVSAATFGVKTSVLASSGVGVYNPAVRKYGIFDNYDGYYWETRNSGEGDNFAVVRRTQSITQRNPLVFGTGGGQQTQDYGVTNPYDPLGRRGSENVSAGASTTGTGFVPLAFGDLCIVRDNLLMTHAGVYDASMLQPEHKVSISAVTNGNVLSSSDCAVPFSDVTYDINTGLMEITTSREHKFHEGKFVTLTGIAMTCYLDGNNPEIYPKTGRNSGFNVVKVSTNKKFTVNVGVSTVATFYKGEGWALGVSAGQYVSYSKGTNAGVTTGLTDKKIYKIQHVGLNTTTGITTCSLIDVTTTGESSIHSGLTNTTLPAGHSLITPVPFIQPTNGTLINSDKNKYSTLATNAKNSASAGTGMFPLLYTDADNNTEGYIDDSVAVSNTASLKDQVDKVNDYYGRWVNQNVQQEYWNVYEYRIPRSRFSGDRLDALTDELKYSDVVGDKRAGQNVIDTDTNEEKTDTSIWELDFTKVTMYKIEFSWYGAVGALFLAYVPVSNGEARWVRVHHLRASNQLKISSLGNATLPITYMVQGGGTATTLGYANTLRLASGFQYGSASEHIMKYGASYYIDGGDRGTVKLFSHATPVAVDVYGSRRTVYVGTGNTQVDLANATSATNPYLEGGSTAGLSSSYYVGAKVITGEALDQNIEITYVSLGTDPKLYLNAPLSTSSLSSIKIIPDRPTPLIGLKCRDFIESSTGQSVRNRTQIYPTRLSTGSTQVVKLDLLKTPAFQTDHILLTSTPPALRKSVNIGKRGKPTKVDLPLVSYVGAHTWDASGATGTNALKKVSGGATLNISSAAYDSATGRLTITTSAAHGLSAGNEVRIKKESLAFKCSIDGYATVHTYPRLTDPMMDVNDGAINAGAISVDAANSSYNPNNGEMTIRSNGHGLNTGDTVQFAPYSLTLSCDFNGATGAAAQKKYPREAGLGNAGGGSDPAYFNWLTVTKIDNNNFKVDVLITASSTNTNTHAFVAADANSVYKPAALDGDYSKPLACISASGTTLVVRVTNTQADKGSLAEYIRDFGKGTYGYFRGYFAGDPAKKPISVLGYLENRGYDRTKDILDDGYYFYALESTTDEIVLTTDEPFLREENSAPKDGAGLSGVTTSFTLAQLSSVKINPQTRSPIPKTGTVVASLFVPGSGENYDLSPYFDYNKEYLSFPLTNKVESLYLCASSQSDYNASSAQAEISASLTWEEQ